VYLVPSLGTASTALPCFIKIVLHEPLPLVTEMVAELQVSEPTTGFDAGTVGSAACNAVNAETIKIINIHRILAI
jgi:hypothetical protein